MGLRWKMIRLILVCLNFVLATESTSVTDGRVDRLRNEHVSISLGLNPNSKSTTQKLMPDREPTEYPKRKYRHVFTHSEK